MTFDLSSALLFSSVYNLLSMLSSLANVFCNKDCVSPVIISASIVSLSFCVFMDSINSSVSGVISCKLVDLFENDVKNYRLIAIINSVPIINYNILLLL